LKLWIPLGLRPCLNVSQSQIKISLIKGWSEIYVLC
jgi:hypothetical protein